MAFMVRKAAPADRELAFGWAIDEGWNPGLHDAEAFAAVDPDGFFIGELDGLPVGSISAVAYDEQFGFIGLYIVRPEFRGQGYSVDLWDTGMLHLRGRNVGLACPLPQEAYYGDCGFRTAFRSVRYEGIGGGPAPQGLVDLKEVPIKRLADYDARRFPAPRAGFLEQWIRQPGATALGLQQRGRLLGYGVLRACHKGYKVGPLFANNPDAAEQLFAGLSAAVPSQSIYLDVPEPNTAGMELAGRHKMHRALETAWMYTAGRPKIDLKKVYGTTSRGLG